jgi:hypothetical protein
MASNRDKMVRGPRSRDFPVAALLADVAAGPAGRKPPNSRVGYRSFSSCCRFYEYNAGFLIPQAVSQPPSRTIQSTSKSETRGVWMMLIQLMMLDDKDER